MAADVTVAPTLGHAVLMTQGGVGATPGYDAIDLRRMLQAGSGEREGVFDLTGWKVSENGGGANMTVQVAASVGIARVDGESVTHQGPYIVAPHSATVTLDVAAAHSTNPRIDLVVLHVRDNTHDALGSNDARVRIITGTATSGATLVNLNGSPSVPANAIRLGYVLVPATDTTISNAQISDRRTIAWTAAGSFHAYRAGASSLATGAVVPFDTESWDISGWFDTTTNVGRFTPQIAGYYLFSAHVYLGVTGTGSQWLTIALYKNGAQYAQLGTVMLGGTVTMQTGGGAPHAQANGTTDYFEIVLNHNFGSAQALGLGTGSTWFAGHLIARS